MKRKTGVLIVIIIAYLLGVFSWQMYVRREGSDEKLALMERELLEKKFKNLEGFGVADDGTFFLHKDLIATPKRVLLVILKEKDSHLNDSLSLEQVKDEEIRIQLQKVGNYFIAKPEEKFLNPIYHFETEVERFYPRN